MTYQEINLIHRFVYNQMDYGLFSEVLSSSINCDEGYTKEKWGYFQRCPMQFTASFSTDFFEAVQKQIKKQHYKG